MALKRLDDGSSLGRVRVPKADGADRVRVPKTAELVAARIRKLIVTGALKTGDSLPAEAQLIEDFHVSRPTIREAIRVLEVEGIIYVVRGAHGGGRVVQPHSGLVSRAAGMVLQTLGTTVTDVYEARLLMEPPAARLAATHHSKMASKLLRDHLAYEHKVKNDVVLISQAIADFHRILLEQCGNSALSITALALQGIFEKGLKASQKTRAAMADTKRLKRINIGLKSHQRLVDHIAAGDGQGAQEHWAAHMQAAGKVWLSEIGRLAVVDMSD